MHIHTLLEIFMLIQLRQRNPVPTRSRAAYGSAAAEAAQRWRALG